MKLQLSVVEARQHVASEQVAFVEMGVAREDERVDPEFAVCQELAHHLVRVANDGEPGVKQTTISSGCVGKPFGSSISKPFAVNLDLAENDSPEIPISVL